MIAYANQQTRPHVRAMWKEVFGDSDDYMDIYFGQKYADQNTLVYIDKDKPVASLQMLPVKFNYVFTEIDAVYVCGVCTLPEARRKGFMDKLLRFAIQECYRKTIPLMVLVPQESWLIQYYINYGFAQTFDPKSKPIPQLADYKAQFGLDYAKWFEAFDTWQRQQPMMVMKSAQDFETIVEEATLFGLPQKENLIGMARLTHAETILRMVAQAHPNISCTFCVKDDIIPEQHTTYTLSDGEVSAGNENPQGEIRHLSIIELVNILLGRYSDKQTIELNPEWMPTFTPQINYMLE